VLNVIALVVVRRGGGCRGSGQALADVATIGILHQRVVTRTEVVNRQLRAPLNTGIIIEQARGVLSERGGLSMDDAFKQSRAYARSHNLRLSDYAPRVVDGTADGSVLFDRPISWLQPDRRESRWRAAVMTGRWCASRTCPCGVAASADALVAWSSRRRLRVGTAPP
jgi:hypothetical protein